MVHLVGIALTGMLLAIPANAEACAALPDRCQSAQAASDPTIGEREGKPVKKKARRNENDRDNAPRVKEQSETSSHSILDLFRIVSI